MPSDSPTSHQMIKPMHLVLLYDAVHILVPLSKYFILYELPKTKTKIKKKDTLTHQRENVNVQQCVNE